MGFSIQVTRFSQISLIKKIRSPFESLSANSDSLESNVGIAMVRMNRADYRIGVRESLNATAVKL